MPTSPLDGSQQAIQLTGSMALLPGATLRGSVSMPEPVPSGVLGVADELAEGPKPTVLMSTFSPAEPPITLDLAPPQAPDVLGAAADAMDEVAMVEFMIDPGEAAVYAMLHEVHTPDGIIYDVTMAEPVPSGVLGGSELGAGTMLRCPVHRLVGAQRAPGDQAAPPGVLGGVGDIVTGLLGDQVFKHVLHVIKAPINRALKQKVAEEEGEPQVLIVTADQHLDQPLEGAEVWRARFDPSREHRVLLYIHGFMSNVERSLPRHWVQAFGSGYDAVLAYNHPTIAYSPVQNAVDLLARLPDDLRLNVDLFAHSRGGLVARSLVELQPLTPRLNVQHLLTLGAPHAGTLLAHHKRWDRLISISLTALSWLTSSAAAPLSIATKLLEYLIRAAQQFIFDLPGIQAMDPDSPFLKDLNTAGDATLAQRVRYAAVTSSFDALQVKQVSFREALTAMAAQAFLGTPNDLVVPTESMRSIDLPTALPLGDRVFRTDVDHFTYFNDAGVQTFAGNFLLGSPTG